MGGASSKTNSAVKLGSTPSHGNPASSNQLNTELNNVARNTDDTRLARSLVAQGADLSSTNGQPWRHTALHQAAFHGRYEMAKTLVELGSRLDLHSNPCGRGATGTPIELARGGGHHKIAAMLEEAAKGSATAPSGRKSMTRTSGTWRKYTNIDMCCQGDAEIIGDWKKAHTIESLKAIVEEKGYSAVCVGSFGHAVLKNFDYQLTKEHCTPSQGYTNELYIWFPDTTVASALAAAAPCAALATPIAAATLATPSVAAALAAAALAAAALAAAGRAREASLMKRILLNEEDESYEAGSSDSEEEEDDGKALESAPPLQDMCDKLRAELGLAEMPMAKLVDSAVLELGIEVGEKASVLEKAEAAWRALYL